MHQINRNSAYKYNGFGLKCLAQMVLRRAPACFVDYFYILVVCYYLFLLPVSHMYWLYMTRQLSAADNVAKKCFFLKRINKYSYGIYIRKEREYAK
jgi:hypothetical protein